MNASEMLHRDLRPAPGYPGLEMDELEIAREVAQHVDAIGMITKAGAAGNIQCSTPEIEQMVREKVGSPDKIKFLPPKSVSRF